MYIFENISLAVNGLLANKMRALLTMLGIIIGISSVIAIVTVGTAMTGSVTSVMNDMGANSVVIQLAGKKDENGNRSNAKLEESDRITEDMLIQYGEAFSDKILMIGASEVVGNGQARNGRYKANGIFQGITEDADKLVNLDILAGHPPNDREIKGSKNVVAISDRFVEDLFPGITPQQALGREIKVYMNENIYTFSIIGVYRYEMSGMMSAMAGDISTYVYMPITTAKRIADADEGYDMLQIKAQEGVDTQDFADETKDYLNRFYKSNNNWEIDTFSMDSMIDQMSGMMDTLSIAIGVIAAISLVVGGIGVMNIMLVSVTERTREIGTRKALGAQNSAIRVQFIVESMIICLIGGIIGVILGTALGYLGSSLLGFPGYPSVGIILIAVSFSMLIGIFFGYYPANKAAALDPIEALRYE